MNAILLAAGSGTRMGMEIPKQFCNINGKPLFIHSLEVLKRSKAIDKVILVCNPQFIDDYKKIVSNYDLEPVIYIIGGETRQESVRKALDSVDSEYVMIHEAARPLINEDFINEITAYKECDVVVPTIPIAFTVSIGDEYMAEELDRSKLHNIQLPQMFRTNVLKDAHEKAMSDKLSFTEDSAMAFHYNYKVRFVKGREANIKVTTALDIVQINLLTSFKD